MAEPTGLGRQRQAWLTVSQELEIELVRGFSGDIVLHCLDGVVQSYHVNQKRKPGEERKTQEQRTAGPRNGED